MLTVVTVSGVIRNNNNRSIINSRRVFVSIVSFIAAATRFRTAAAAGWIINNMPFTRRQRAAADATATATATSTAPATAPALIGSARSLIPIPGTPMMSSSSSSSLLLLSTSSSLSKRPIVTPLSMSKDQTEPPSPKRRKTKRQPRKLIIPEGPSSSTNSDTSNSNTETATATETETETDKAKTTKTTNKKKKTSTKKKQRQRQQRPLPGSKAPPDDGWEEIWELVEELRADKSAPVDTDGAEVLPQQGDGVDDTVYRFQILVALMLSSQTKDKVVGEAMRNLQKHAGGLTIDNIRQMSHEDLNHLIQKVGFHNNKTKYIKQTAEILHEKHGGDIPKTPTEMIEQLPGVGPKMAFIVESIAWGTQSGIGIDTHMHRMFNQLGWVPHTKNPEMTRVELEAWLPREKWVSANYLWVGFGQEVQQFKGRLLRKVVNCSKPREALKLVKRLGLDYNVEAAKVGDGLEDEIRAILRNDDES